MPNTSYVSAVLISRITNYLDKPSIFVGNDNWGTWQSGEVGKMQANKDYIAINVTPASLDIDSRIVHNFKKIYRKRYQQAPDNAALLIGYRPIASIVDAMKLCRKTKNIDNMTNITRTILRCYQDVLEQHKNWYRENQYAVYKMQRHGQVYLDTIRT